MYSSKIYAIKALRCDMVAQPEVKTEDGKTIITPGHIGLKEAKDFVEACMELGAKEYKDTAARVKAVEALKPGDKVTHDFYRATEIMIVVEPYQLKEAPDSDMTPVMIVETGYIFYAFTNLLKRI